MAVAVAVLCTTACLSLFPAVNPTTEYTDASTSSGTTTMGEHGY